MTGVQTCALPIYTRNCSSRFHPAAYLPGLQNNYPLLDNRNYHIGGVDPETLPAGASKIARLNIKGRMIDFLTYEDTYTELDGTVKQYIPQGMIAVGAPAAGRTVYGAITQVEQSDGEFHTYTGVNVPKYISDATHNLRELVLSSAPLPMPNNECPFSVAKVIN